MVPGHAGALPAAQADQPSCEQRSERVMQKGIRIFGRTNLFRVVTERVLLLHTAAAAACIPQQPLALTPGMDVIAYVIDNDDAAVLWNPPGSTKPGVFWFRSAGLEALGYGIAPR